jgi:hypothetical protein
VAEEWRGVLNAILYGLIFTPELSDESVDTAARQLIARRVYREPTQYYYDAIREALGRNVPMNSGMTEHSQADTRRFFERLLARLDHYRPWPEPPYLKQDISLWRTFGQARSVASIGSTELQVGNWLGELFDAVPDDDEDRRGLILRLRSGRMVALLAPANKTATGVTVLQREPVDPEAAVADFCEATGCSRDQITIVPARHSSLWNRSA